MKKILYVTNITRTVNTFFIPHMNMLVNKGYIVDCACKISGEHNLNKNKLNDTINFYDIPFTRNPLSYKNIIAFFKLYKIQKSKKYDIIHVHTPIAGMYTRLLKIWFKDIKIIYTAHGFHFHKNSSKINWLIFYPVEKLLAKYTDTLITINDEDFKIAKSFNCKDVRKIPGVGVDFSKFRSMSNEEKFLIRSKVNLEKDDFVFIMVGEHNKNKNQIQLIKAIEVLSRKNKKVKALLIGDGEYLENNKRYVKENNINNILILGFRKDVNELINCSDVLVSMSYREGLPKNIIEGMAVSKPIIATKIRGNEDLVKNDYNGYLVSCGDVEDTIEKINKIINLNSIDFEKMRKNSKELSKQYSIENILKDLEKVYL